MAEDRVILTAEMKDELSAPLDSLQSKVKATERAVTTSAQKQASSTKASSTTIMSALGEQDNASSRLTRSWSKLSSIATGAWGGAKSAVVTAGQKIISASRDAGDKSGKELGGAFGSSMKNTLGAAAAAAGIASIGAGMSTAVNAFSELEDATAAAGTIYGKNMDAIIAKSKGAGEALGMTEQQYIAAAQSFGIAGTSAGLSGDALAKFSSDLTSRAGDMASFFGKKPEEAIEAIGAAMRGETEPIRAFGVMLDDATMREKALKMGLVSTTKDALEPQHKALVAQALILEKTKMQQGDFNKTMDSTANVAKRLEAAQTNLSAKMGQVLAPMFTAVRMKALGAVNGTSKFVDRIIAAQGALKKGAKSQDIAKALGFGPGVTAFLAETIGSVRAFKAAVADPAGGVTSNGAAGVFERIGIAVGTAKLGVSAFFSAMKDGDVTSDGFVGKLEQAGVVARQVGFGIEALFASMKSGDVTSDGFVGVMERIGVFLGKLQPSAWLGIAGGAGLLLAAFGKFSPILAPIMGIFTRLGPLIGGLGGALKFLLGPIGLIAGLFIYAYTTSEPFRAAINSLLPLLLSLGQLFAAQLAPVFTMIATTLLPALVGLFAQLVPIFIQVLMAVMPIVITLASQLLPLFMQLIAAVLPPLMGLLTTLAPIFMTLLGAIVPLIPPIMQIITMLIRMAIGVITPLIPVIGILAGIFSKVLGGAIEMIMPIIKFLIDRFVELVTFLEGPLTSAVGFVGGIFEGIAKTIGDVAKAVSDFASNPLGGLQDMLGIPKNSGGGVYSGGGVAGYAGGGVLGGYAPGVDSIPAMLSPGESVLVPELTRAIGPSNIMAANRIASGGRPAGSGPALTGGFSRTAPQSGGGSTTVVAEGAVQINITARDGISEADIQKIKRVVEGIFDEAESRSY